MATPTCNTSLLLPFDASLLHLPLAELAQRSTEESQKYAQKQPNDSSVILALFYRACENGKDADDAWAALYQQYASLVLSWITRYRGSKLALLKHEEMSVWSLVDAAWEKFARSVSHKIQHFTRLPQLLSYFEHCTHSILADRARTCLSTQYQKQSTALSWEDLKDAPGEPISLEIADLVEQHCFAEHLWAVIDTCLRDDSERLLLHLSFQKQMRPEEIQSDYPTLYATVDDVYRIKRNVIARLSRSTRLMQFLADYDELPLSSYTTERRKVAS